MSLLGKKKSKISPKKAKSPDDLYVEKLKVYKMPEKYLSSASVKKSSSSDGGGGKKTLIVVVVVILVLGIGGTIAFFLLSAPQSSPSGTATPKPPVKEPTSLSDKQVPDDNNSEDPQIPTDGTVINNQPGRDEMDVPTEDPKIPDNSIPTDKTPPENVKPSNPIDAVDSDTDGLTDQEESLYQTHSRKEDSDFDGFNDAEEVMNLYDPASSNKKLEDSLIVKKYNVTLLGHDLSLLYPAGWNVQPNENNIKFIATEGDNISVRIDSLNNSPSPEKSFSAWYATVSPISDDFDSLSKFVSKDFDAYQSADGLYVFLVKKDVVYIFNYDISATNIYYYRSTFKMMMNSFNVTE